MADEAARAYEKARAAYEFAAMRTDSDAKARALSEFLAAGEHYARTLNAEITWRRASAPSFEQILGDFTQQLDPHSEIIKSMTVYKDVPSSTINAVRGAADD